MCQVAGAPVELLIGEPLVLEDDGVGVGRAIRLRFHEVMQAFGR